ncbi:hypothetical protein N7474_009141 [Penicillium riverlandense]|uniref:uncharacterized protein n=1 Tax=Penicillium riverlandense TaxID=1903569 RepID=UPI0025470336|nr:uncharacterized protein N7474_009141 [Penicillium riverlandense]KAJ5807872.1 hypothetical protein N7474_009141 [Penicillium riverlandense]
MRTPFPDLLDSDSTNSASYTGKGFFHEPLSNMDSDLKWQTSGQGSGYNVHDRTGCSEDLESLPPVSMMEIPVSSSRAHSPGVQSLEYAPESLSHYLSPENYVSHRRDSCISDTMGSVYAWSNASSTAELYLRATPPPSSVGRSGTTSPFMQDYLMPGHSGQLPLPSSFTDIPGYTPPSIDGLGLEPEPPGGFYPALSPLHYPSAIPDNMCTAAESWMPLPAAFVGPSAMSSPNLSAPDAFLSPPPSTAIFPNAPTSNPVSGDSASILSTSPTPTFTSDLDGSPPGTSSSRTRPSSPSSPSDLTRYGIPIGDGAWRCAHPGCSSQAIFRRGCDLRKHYNRHRKHLFCRHEGCPQATHGGFSSKKDRARHEAKHNPGIVCEWHGCGRVFSRVDNMKDHVRRIHRRTGPH